MSGCPPTCRIIARPSRATIVVLAPHRESIGHCGRWPHGATPTRWRSPLPPPIAASGSRVHPRRVPRRADASEASRSRRDIGVHSIRRGRVRRRWPPMGQQDQGSGGLYEGLHGGLRMTGRLGAPARSFSTRFDAGDCRDVSRRCRAAPVRARPTPSATVGGTWPTYPAVSTSDIIFRNTRVRTMVAPAEGPVRTRKRDKGE